MKLTAIFTDSKGKQYRPVQYGEIIRNGDLRLVDFLTGRASKLPKDYIGKRKEIGYGPMLTPVEQL